MSSIEELKQLIGKKGNPTVRQIDPSMIRLYLDTIGDKSPKWEKEVPPGLLTGVLFMGEGVPMQWPYPGIVDAGLELEYLKPIKVGDTLTIVNELSGVEDKSSERGKRILFSMKTTITNQNKDVVATLTGRVMNLG